MPSPSESREALQLVADEAVGAGQRFAGALSGSPELKRAALFEVVPSLIGAFSEATATLALDFYSDAREAAGITTPYVVQAVVADRTTKIYNATAWAADAWASADELLVASRLAEVIQLEVARPFRDTILTNRRMDPASAGWRRVANNCCRFCRMLADRGAVYRQATARFAAHPHCDCGAEPVFEGQVVGPEASAMQYMASKRTRTVQQKAALREYLNNFY